MELQPCRTEGHAGTAAQTSCKEAGQTLPSEPDAKAFRFPNILDGRLSEFYSIEIKNMKLLNLFNLSMEDSLDLRFDQEEVVFLVEQIWPRTCLASLVLEITS